MSGLVSLVGAGPGDPELLTLRAADRLRRADLVLYDALVPDAMLGLAATAQRFRVGKRAGRRSVAQETIHAVMVRAARRGRRVVRLKGGDPCLFGRGGEEALALAAAGVPFELVPGVTASVAAPALAGIPVTHRGVSSAVLVLSGHAPEAWQPLVSGVPPHTATLVVLMGLRSRAPIAAALLERGWRPATPAAIVRAASTPGETTWWGTLGELEASSGAQAGGDEAPGTIVIGEVVAVGARIARALGKGTFCGDTGQDDGIGVDARSG